jgi:hypothetical protein
VSYLYLPAFYQQRLRSFAFRHNEQTTPGTPSQSSQ